MQPSTPCSQGVYTCPQCWRSDRDEVSEYASLSAASSRLVVACSECAARRRRAGEILDYIGPVAA